MASTSIEWATDVWNPLAGCTPISDGCKFCYAATMALRLEAMGQAKYAGTAKRTASARRAVFTGKINLDRAALEIPLGWKRPRRIFVNSMSDLFHDAVPDHFILEVFAVMERCPWHVFQVLTKRPERMAAWVSKHRDWVEYAAGEGEYLRRYGHVWCGTSVEHQAAADQRIPELLKVPARVRFLSCEPLLGPIDLSAWLICPKCKGEGTVFHTIKMGNRSFLGGDVPCPACKGTIWRRDLSWVIVGGESGPGARPMHPDWPRRLREDCQNAGIAYFFKQWGAWLPISDMSESEHDALYHPVPEDRPMARQRCKVASRAIRFDGGDDYRSIAGHCSYLTFNVGKKAAGRLLDGREWNQFPGESNENA